ncbi:MAG: cupin domain-containing protein [Haloferacaceae archaeon]
MGTDTAPWEGYDRIYRAFRDDEGVPVHTGHVVDDVREVEVGDWERTGGRGAFLNLQGMEYMSDLQVHEIPAGERLKTQRHLHEAIVFVIGGQGFTSLEGDGDEQTVFEWTDRSLFFLPRNTPYTHVNSSDEPARLLAMTTLPLLYSLVHEDEAIWQNDSFDQWSKIRTDDFYSSVSEQRSVEHNRTFWDANFVPDATNFDKLDAWPERGGGGRSVFFPFTGSSMFTHISEFPPGRYKKAHRHVGGSSIVILSGEGYSRMWTEGDDERLRIDWSPYSVFVPPTLWYHQHFNTSAGRARYMAMHGPLQGLGINQTDEIYFMDETNQIEYPDEDPTIREEFREELEEKGIEYRMEPALYER